MQNPDHKQEIKALRFVEPVRTLSAKEISALPYSQMIAQIEAQESHNAKERGVGGMAGEILQTLRGGRQSQKRQRKNSVSFFLTANR